MTNYSSVIDHVVESGLKQLRRKIKRALLKRIVLIVTRDIFQILNYLNMYFYKRKYYLYARLCRILQGLNNQIKIACKKLQNKK